MSRPYGHPIQASSHAAERITDEHKAAFAADGVVKVTHAVFAADGVSSAACRCGRSALAPPSSCRRRMGNMAEGRARHE